MPLNDPVPSSAFDVAKRNASDLDNLLQQDTGTVETRTGKQLLPWQVAMQRYAAYNNTGAWATGTAYQVNDIWESSGTWYVVLTAYTSGATAGDDIASGNVQVWQVRDFVSGVDTIADLRALEPLFDGQQIELLGHTIAGIGGAIYYADFSDTTSLDNGRTVIVTTGGRRWRKRDPDDVSSVVNIANLRALEPAFDYQQVEILGNSVAGVGSGKFYSDFSDTTSADDGFSVIVTPGGRRWKRDFEVYSIDMLGISDGMDAAPALQAIINKIVAEVQAETYGDFTVRNVIEIPAGEYNLSAQVDTKPYIKIISRGFVMWNVQHSNRAFSCTLDNSDPVEEPSSNKIKQSWARGSWLSGRDGGMRIWRDGGALNGSGLYVNSTATAGRVQIGRWKVDNVSIGGFQDGIELGTLNNFLGLFDSVHVENNTNQITTEASGSNVDFGENFRFVDSTIATGVGVLHRKSGLDINFIGCSLDFNSDVIQYVASNDGFSTTKFTSCYFEGVSNAILNNTIGASNVSVYISNCWGLLSGSQAGRWFKGSGDVSINGFEIRALPRTNNIVSPADAILCDSTISLYSKVINYSRDVVFPVHEGQMEMLPGEAFFTSSTTGNNQGNLTGWTSVNSSNITTVVIDTDGYSGGKSLQLTPSSNAANLTLETTDGIASEAGARYAIGLLLRSDVTQTLSVGIGTEFNDKNGNRLALDTFTPNPTISAADNWAIVPLSGPAFDAGPSGTDNVKFRVSISPDSPVKFGGIIVNRLQ